MNREQSAMKSNRLYGRSPTTKRASPICDARTERCLHDSSLKRPRLPNGH